MGTKTKTIEKIKSRRVVFTLEAPEAKGVILMADFNNWNAENHPMKRNKKGFWEKIVMLQPGRYEYKFLVDGDWRNDPRNSDLCQNRFGTQNNVITIPPN